MLFGGLLAAAIGSLFSGGDVALQALPEARLQSLSEDPTFERYLADRQQIVSRWLVCRVIAIAIASALYADAARGLGLASIGLLVAVLGAVLTYGAFAEITGAVARGRPETTGALALRVLRLIEWVVIPLAAPLAALGRIVLRRVPDEPARSQRITETEVEWMVNQGVQAGSIGGEPAEIIRNALDLGTTLAREVMVPRRKICTIDAGTSIDNALDIVAAEGHSRYPVYQGSIDQIIGLLYAKDIFRVVREKRIEQKLESIMRTGVLFVTETQLVAPILREMRAKHLHMAVVTDEFGGTSGIITLEDILEEIVGDIRDEHDTEAQIEETPEGRVLADASVSLADLSAHLKREIPADGDFESLGGLLVHRAGRVPEVGATLELDGITFIVREADETRVVKVEIVWPAA